MVAIDQCYYRRGKLIPCSNFSMTAKPYMEMYVSKEILLMPAIPINSNIWCCDLPALMQAHWTADGSRIVTIL